MAYAVGHISGGHFNPAVTVGLWAGKRCATGDVIPYIVAQVIGAIVAAAVLYWIASGKPGWIPGNFASNGYGDLSPGVQSRIMPPDGGADDVFFLLIIIGCTSKGAAVGLRRHSDRAGADADPFGVDPGDRHLGQSGAEHRSGVVCRWRLRGAALAVLAGTDRRSAASRPGYRAGCMRQTSWLSPNSGEDHIVAPSTQGANSAAPKSNCSLLVRSPEATRSMSSKMRWPHCCTVSSPSRIVPQFTSMSSAMR